MSKRAATDMSSSSSSAPPSPSPPPQPRAAADTDGAASADAAAPAFPHLDALPAPPFPLTLNERRLFETILATCAHQRLRTTVRCAGGWVRDKLLGRSSHDVDLAVDGDMTGAQFADLLVAHVAQHCPGVRASGVGVIRKNPDQSKHLETATFVLHGLAVDCVALRSETYTDSRIPQTAAGTAEQDAQRRDFTFNALFLNLATMRVEDLCGTGRADLAAGLLRTPLPAAQTFADDPLRVLRAVRFSARFGFRMDAELRAAAADPAVHAAFGKVSRERYGIELLKMLEASGAAPAIALRHVVEFGLCPIVFALPERDEAAASASAASASAANDGDFGAAGLVCVQRLNEFLRSGCDFVAMAAAMSGASAPSPASSSSSSSSSVLDLSARYSTAQWRDSHLAAFLAPLHGRAPARVKARAVPVAHHVIMHAVKLTTECAQNVCALHEVAHAMRALIARVAAAASASASSSASSSGTVTADETEGSAEDTEEDAQTRAAFAAAEARAASAALAEFGAWTLPANRVELGNLLRKTRERWPQFLDLAFVLADSAPAPAVALTEADFARCARWIAHESGLNACWHWTAFIKGDQLAREWHVQGAGITDALVRQLEWRMCHEWRAAVRPSLADAPVSEAEAAALVARRAAQLRLQCVRHVTKGMKRK